jgi:hypothetical protein
LNDFFVVVLLILGLVAAAVWRRHLRDAKLLRLREMVHQERMADVKSNASNEKTSQQLDELLLEMAEGQSRPSNPVAAVAWVRLVALCIGLAGFFGGIGTAIGMYAVTSEPEISGAWSMGIIPATVGLGLLVCYILSRNFALESNGD